LRSVCAVAWRERDISDFDDAVIRLYTHITGLPVYLSISVWKSGSSLSQSGPIQARKSALLAKGLFGI
ncbi:MAG: hypothetical protein VXX79_10510, partial [Pseudomonadota bacterium]|nr:hypothetical protein [Pseudomonadota bacterium]